MKAYKAYKAGQHVKHNQYGPGTIVSSNEDRTSIEFLEHGTKLFVTSLVQLEPATLEEVSPPTKKPRRARPTSRRRPRAAKAAAH